MALLDSHRYLCSNIDVSADEHEQLSKLASTVLQAKSDDDAQEILRALLESASDSALYKIANAIDVFSEIETDMEKQADFQRIAHGIAALLSTVPVLSELGRIGSQFSGRRVAVKDVMKRNPELKNDPNVEKYVQMITTFAPQVAANEILLGHVLMQLHRMGRENVTPETIKNLVEFESESRKTRGELPRQIGQLSGTITDLSRGFGGSGARKSDSKSPGMASGAFVGR